MLKVTGPLFLAIFALGCQDHFDAEQVGKEYCDCIKVNADQENYQYAEITCNAKFANGNRYFRAFHLGEDAIKPSTITVNETPHSLTSADSFKFFQRDFNDYVSERCSYQVYHWKKDSLELASEGPLIPRFPAFAFMRGIKTCADAESLATIMAKQGKFKVISWGLPGAHAYDDFYKKYLLYKYNIEVINGGCLEAEIPACFDEKMKSILIEKYDSLAVFYMLHEEPRKAFYSSPIGKIKRSDFPE